MEPTRTLGQIAAAHAYPGLRYDPSLPAWPVSAALLTSRVKDIVVAMDSVEPRCAERGQAVP